ncbi:MAG: hypothetical protein HQK52_22710 [Oligoflexia bacterium]|nr:hypothetical protein [Oligoflexia bacterium]
MAGKDFSNELNFLSANTFGLSDKLDEIDQKILDQYRIPLSNQEGETEEEKKEIDLLKKKIESLLLENKSKDDALKRLSTMGGPENSRQEITSIESSDYLFSVAGINQDIQVLSKYLDRFVNIPTPVIKLLCLVIYKTQFGRIKNVNISRAELESSVRKNEITSAKEYLVKEGWISTEKGYLPNGKISYFFTLNASSIQL